ncbi:MULTISPECIES: sugar porter family MFS transporter [Inquilinus]|uniref:Sugar porter (SP) family MFS transporter n=1 Tax=Inquilinus ginsengisoli TaxID=363840 RepID=A0ABU1JIP7_9PROT|nr:sugar porter family MFS transporter [Inquilinus ginsengisoli]MDR6287909.1 sugar porter (SP) family MFS transporter [Inquilinus ginsengisoli]
MSTAGNAPRGSAATSSSGDDFVIGKTFLIALSAAMGGFLFGYDTSVINGAVAAIRTWSGAGEVLLGFSVASALLGSAVGAWFAGPVADRYGRIAVMQIAAVIFLIGSVGSGLAWSIWSLTALRFLGGLAVGAASVIAPAYIAEVSPAHIRGRLGSLQQLAIVVGIFVALLCDYALVAAAGGAEKILWFGLEAWRWMFISMAVPSVIYGVLAGIIPESPRFLVSKKRLAEAADVLRRFVGNKPPPQVKIAEIEHSIDRENKQSLRDLLGPAAGLLPIVWTGILLSVFQQFVGINVIFYYSSVLWQAVGFTEADSLIITVATSVTNILTTLVAIALIDRVGRKPLLLIGSAGMTLALGTMAYIFGTAPTEMVNGALVPVLPGQAGVVAVVAANLYVVFFGVSWGPVVWVLLGEMFSNRIRAYALAVAAAAQWVANFFVSETFPSLASAGLGIAYGIYALMAVLSFIFVARAVRETRGRELEDME